MSVDEFSLRFVPAVEPRVQDVPEEPTGEASLPQHGHQRSEQRIEPQVGAGGNGGHGSGQLPPPSLSDDGSSSSSESDDGDRPGRFSAAFERRLKNQEDRFRKIEKGESRSTVVPTVEQPKINTPPKFKGKRGKLDTEPSARLS
jgi:hypothetical protein